MTFSVLHGLAAGAVVTGAIVAFVVRPAALAPHPAPAPTLATAVAGDDAPPRGPVARETPPAAIVYVAGAVAHPGVYALPSGARAIDAVTKAGGLTRDADAVAVNLAARVTDGDEIAVPHAGESAAPATGATGTTANHRRRRAKKAHRGRRRADAGDAAAGPSEEPRQLVNLNTADATTLATIPGIGPTLAERIVEFREVNGPYPTVDALADVSGITAAHFDAIAAYLTVGRP
jgi:competence protein ComEA